MRYSEIGSEFWENPCYEDGQENPIVFNEQKRGFLCGRTALDHIIRDAKEEYGIRSSLLPSYCCHTMIEPFLRNGIAVRFYSVVATENGLTCILPEPKEQEVLYLMYYFGFKSGIETEKGGINEWDLIILDETHSCFRKGMPEPLNDNVKYRYISYRKWTDIRGFAMAEKVRSNFLLPPPGKQNKDYAQLKEQACLEKKNYIDKEQGNKAEFLQKYQEAENLLEEQYVDFAALEEGIWAYKKLDIEKVREKRRENVAYLIENLQRNNKVQLLFPKLKKEDCPLFMPILVKDGKRDMLRRYLIEKAIYCPTHWPLSEYHQLQSDDERLLYNDELSLVCDQRYGLEEMERIVDSINSFFKHCS